MPSGMGIAVILRSALAHPSAGLREVREYGPPLVLFGLASASAHAKMPIGAAATRRSEPALQACERFWVVLMPGPMRMVTASDELRPLSAGDVLNPTWSVSNRSLGVV